MDSPTLHRCNRAVRFPVDPRPVSACSLRLSACSTRSSGGITISCCSGMLRGDGFLPRRTGYRGEIVIILANGKTNEFAQRTGDTEALWVRLGERPDATGWQMKPKAPV